jgi:transposase
MCRLHLDAHDHLTAKIAALDQLVAGAAAPFGAVIARLVTIAGIGQRTAEVIVAETGRPSPGSAIRSPSPTRRWRLPPAPAA